MIPKHYIENDNHHKFIDYMKKNGQTFSRHSQILHALYIRRLAIHMYSLFVAGVQAQLPACSRSSACDYFVDLPLTHPDFPTSAMSTVRTWHSPKLLGLLGDLLLVGAAGAAT